jgi:hypothetical protein
VIVQEEGIGNPGAYHRAKRIPVLFPVSEQEIRVLVHVWIVNDDIRGLEQQTINECVYFFYNRDPRQSNHERSDHSGAVFSEFKCRDGKPGKGAKILKTRLRAARPVSVLE